jgi:hypothetical protein
VIERAPLIVKRGRNPATDFMYDALMMRRARH